MSAARRARETPASRNHKQGGQQGIGARVAMAEAWAVACTRGAGGVVTQTCRRMMDRKSGRVPEADDGARWGSRPRRRLGDEEIAAPPGTSGALALAVGRAC